MILAIAAVTALMALGVIAATVAAIFLIVRLLERLDADGRGAAADDGDGDGGSGVRPAPDGDPPWWPDFERGLDDYLALRSPAAVR
jgi:hypothetical protein